MICFEQPLWLLLLLPLWAWLAFRPFGSRTANVLQGLIFLVLTLALAGTGIRLPEKRGTLMILCDRSLSMPPGSGEKMLRTIREINGRRPAGSRLGVLAFAGESVLERAPAEGAFDGFASPPRNRDATDLAEALTQGLGQIPRGAPGRILLISDGRWNGLAPDDLFTAAAMRNIAVDFLPLKRENAADFAVTEISGPASAAPGEHYTLSCRIRAPFAAEVRCRIRRNKGPWQERVLALREGENRCFWRDRANRSGTAAYDVELLPPAKDTIPENNTARHFVRITGEERLLLVTDSVSGNLAKLLRNSGFHPDVLPPERLTPELLGSCQALILENVPCSSVTPAVNRLAAELVRKGRLGVLMTGGMASFAVGGWFRSPLGEVLPAAMEKQHELRRNRSAVMVALDRSGSMAVSIDGVTKMSMANLAAVESFNLLSPEDEFGLTAVDSSVHEVVPFAPKKELGDAPGNILAIESMGGGIFVDKALHDGVEKLLRSKAPVRHLLLFADAADAEQPGDYRELLARSSKAGITVSVVGLGSEKDSDAGLLREIARLGGGRCYFSDRADELPRIFAEDTFVMVRNSFKKGKTRGRFTGAAAAAAGGEGLTGTMECGGFNLSFPKEKSTVLRSADDEDDAPLAIIGYAGLGRSAALNIEADGAYTGKFASDPRLPRLLAFLARYVSMPRGQNGADFLITSGMREGEFLAETALDPERKSDPFDTPPCLTLLILTPEGKVESRSAAFRWTGPDRLGARAAIPPGGIVTGAVEGCGNAPIPLPPAVRSISPEFTDGGDRDIVPLVRLTGGRVKGAFSDIWEHMPRKQEKRSCVNFLLGAGIVLILLQAALRRFGWELPAVTFRFTLPRSKRTSPHRKFRAGRSPDIPEEKETVPPERSAAEPEDEDFSAALKQAKRK